MTSLIDQNEISEFMFQLSLRDTVELRNKYRRSMINLPIGVVINSKRNTIIEHLTQEKFGADKVQEYKLMCIEWDVTENLKKHLIK